MTQILHKYLIALILCFSISKTSAQVCAGALGDPVINIDFGRGSNTIGPSLSSSTTNYEYINGTPNDGQYTISKDTYGMHADPRGWFQIPNHTPNDPTGYMMIVNASNNPGIFYQTTINGLCPNTTYEFAAWIMNILNYSGNKPNITFEIYDTQGNLISPPYNTGDISESTTATWKQYGLLFKTPQNTTNIILKMINNGPGGIGNDLALDDITFRACGPVIKPSIIETSTTTTNLCEGANASYNLKAEVSQGYSDPVYQWQTFLNDEWVNLINETNLQTMVNFNNAIKGDYKYRLTVAERQNINSVNCRTYSPILSVRVNEIPNPIATNNGPACFGGDIQLFTNNVEIDDPNDIITYSWVGSNFFSNAKNPSIINMNYLNAGTYTVTVTKNGCSKSSTTEVVVLPKITLTTNIKEAIICEGEGVQLEVFGGNDPANQYLWSPSIGLSNDKIASPIAKPTKTTVYNVKVGRGNCFSNATITVKVLDKAFADAGKDKKILKGQSTMLQGQIIGRNNVKYSWSPIDYLDDPTKLNPLASPPSDIVYKLTTQTDCNVSTDDVKVKVYQNIEIPNTFSPNGDGINDVWLIPSIENFENIRLKVVNRLGQLVYETTNTIKSWDGKLKGKDLPVGTYYYTLYINNNLKTYSGWLFLTR